MNRPILLVDDNPMDVELTQLAFRKSKLTNPIEVARDGEEALAWIPRWEAGEPTQVVILQRTRGSAGAARASGVAAAAGGGADDVVDQP
jgi:hypothetical protein